MTPQHSQISPPICVYDTYGPALTLSEVFCVGAGVAMIPIVNGVVVRRGGGDW